MPHSSLSSFEELGELLAVEAVKDMDRVHYKADRKISDLWEEERSALLPLPNVPFEAMRLDSAVLNNYAQFRFEKATYAVPQGKPRQKVLLSVYWNRIEVRNREGELLTTLPRHTCSRAAYRLGSPIRDLFAATASGCALSHVSPSA